MKKVFKIASWIIGIIVFLIIGLLMVVVNPWHILEHNYLKHYPTACWTDDGKQIIYLMNKQIYTVVPSKLWASKTYLFIMDANGKNNKMIGEVPEEIVKNAKFGPKWHKIIFESKNNDLFIIANGKYKVDLMDNKWDRIGDEYYTGKDWFVAKRENKINRYKIYLNGDSKRSVNILNEENKEVAGLEYEIEKAYLFFPYWWKV